MQEHPDAVQFRAARDGRGDPRAAVQFVRKLSGFTKPSKANGVAFAAAVDDIAAIAKRLLDGLETQSPPRNREEEAAKARARVALRFAR